MEKPGSRDQQKPAQTYSHSQSGKAFLSRAGKRRRCISVTSSAPKIAARSQAEKEAKHSEKREKTRNLAIEEENLQRFC